jgi:hypothetical protein
MKSEPSPPMTAAAQPGSGKCVATATIIVLLFNAHLNRGPSILLEM